MLGDLLKLIPKGKENAIHGEELAAKMGISERGLRASVDMLRKSGTCIIADKSGYYRPGNTKELDAYIKRNSMRKLEALAKPQGKHAKEGAGS